MNNDTPITDKQAGWAVAGQYGISRGKELMPDKDGPFVHACIARKLERENARLREALVFIRDECDWEEPKGDFGGGGDSRIGPVISAALSFLPNVQDETTKRTVTFK